LRVSEQPVVGVDTRKGWSAIEGVSVAAQRRGHAIDHLAGWRRRRRRSHSRCRTARLSGDCRCCRTTRAALFAAVDEPAGAGRGSGQSVTRHVAGALERLEAPCIPPRPGGTTARRAVRVRRPAWTDRPPPRLHRSADRDARSPARRRHCEHGWGQQRKSGVAAGGLGKSQRPPGARSRAATTSPGHVGLRLAHEFSAYTSLGPAPA